MRYNAIEPNLTFVIITFMLNIFKNNKTQILIFIWNS